MPVLSLPGSADLLSLHQANPQRYPVLLETASGDGWDILLAFPQQTLLFNGQAEQCLSQQVIRALFPGGTITGCPKVRSMQIIRELEVMPRYAYTGSMGYLNRDGDMDLNILIRTIMVVGDRIGFSAGAGIVADSDPVVELNETRAKARGLLRALGLAG